MVRKDCRVLQRGTYVVRFEHRKVFKNLPFGCARRQQRKNIAHAYARIADAGAATRPAGFYRDALYEAA